MDSKLLLVKSITLLYKEGLLEDPTENSAALVKSIIAAIRLPEVTMETDPGRQAIIALKATALWMCENPPGHRYDRGVMLQRIRVNVGEEEGLYLGFLNGIDDVETPEAIKRSCVELRAGLRSYLNQTKVKEILKRASSKVLFNEEEVNWSTFVQDVTIELEPFIRDITGVSKEGTVDEVSFDDPAKIAELLSQAKDDLTSEGVLRCGWQGINKMLGEHCGFRRGACVVVPALQHNFKTGFSTNLFRQFALYNKPYMLDPKKKPLLIRITSEDPLRDNILALYVQLKVNETKMPCDLKDVDVFEAAKYVKQRLEANGYSIYMAHWNPSDVTYNKIFDLVTHFESLGYEIHAFQFDYLNMIPKTGCINNGPSGSEVRDLFRRVRNFMASRKITFITPHQLSTEAKMLVRQGIENFVQEVANKGYYDSCRTIDQEVDLEIYIHIVKINGKSYLTIQRGKHRGLVNQTPEADLYCVYAFDELGILDDINGPSMARRHAGGGVVGSSDEIPWFAEAA